MSDLYTVITQVPPEILEVVGSVLEVRAADPQHQAMLQTYLADAAIPQGAHVLEVGCGTGAVTRVLAAWPGVVEAIGVDPSPVLLAKARELAAGLANLTFKEADGRALPFADQMFDVVVFHTTLCHVPEPEAMLREAVRVLCSGGCLAVFEGDYATATLATGPGDPLEVLAVAFREGSVNDPWLVRRLPALVRSVGLRSLQVRSYGYVEAPEPGWMLPSMIGFGADALAASGRIGVDLAAALKAEAQRRIASEEYFGHIAYMSCVAHKLA